MSKLQPLNGYLILRPVEEEEQMYGNIVIPDLGKEKPEMGEVVATSSTYNFNSDKFVESNLYKSLVIFALVIEVEVEVNSFQSLNLIASINVRKELCRIC